MECPSCHGNFDLREKRPHNLLCGHTICLECIKQLGSGGELKCPIDQEVVVANDLSDFPESRALIETLTSASLHCEHGEACAFCTTDLVPTCEQCKHTAATCTSLDLLSNIEEIKHALVDVLKPMQKDNWPSTLKRSFEVRFRLPLVELYQLYTAVSRLVNMPLCCDCQNIGPDYVHLLNFSLFCTGCYNKQLRKYPDLNNICTRIVDCRDAVIAKAREMLRKIHFYHISRTHYDWLYTPPADMCALLTGAQAIEKLQHYPEIELPDQFICPKCLKLQRRGEQQLRRLLCSQVVHVMCEKCSQTCTISTTCPLDNQTFGTTGLLLPIYFRAQVDQSSLIGKGMFLANKGICIPPFTPPSFSFPLAAAERFFTVLPPREPLVAPTQEERTFMEPWYINFYPNQVEALTFQPFSDVTLWGLGLANPVEYGKKAVVQWARLYRSERGSGNDYQELYLNNTELIGGNSSVVTDIYFAQPCQLAAFAWVTIKLHLGVPGQQEKLPIYHGNHIGRREDLKGSDDMCWDTRQTYCVEDSERNSGQQHFIGPILRFIYQSS